MLSADTVIDEQLRLPSLPAIVGRLNEVLADRLPAMGEVSELISEDPALAARVLRLVNSPLYPFQGRVDSLQRAVTLIGVREIRNLALAAAAVDLGREQTNRLFSIEQFWRHSLFVALISRGLAAAIGQREIERFFVMGLLHDLGALALYHQFPDQGRVAAERSVRERRPLAEVEQELIGFNHAEAGGHLMRRWNLPESIVAAVAGHHDAPLEGEHRLGIAVVRLADLLAASLDEGYLCIGHREGVGISDWESLGCRDSLSEPILADAQRSFELARAALFV